LAIYESMVILSGRLENQEVEQEIEKVKNLIESGNGTLHSVERMGKRRLAYEIRKEWDGHYLVLHFIDEPDRIATLQRAFRLNEAVLRHIVFRKDKLPEGPTVAVVEEAPAPAAEAPAPPAPEPAKEKPEPPKAEAEPAEAPAPEEPPAETAEKKAEEETQA
jgi:small subunit ribosomal protein S6